MRADRLMLAALLAALAVTPAFGEVVLKAGAVDTNGESQSTATAVLPKDPNPALSYPGLLAWRVNGVELLWEHTWYYSPIVNNTVGASVNVSSLDVVPNSITQTNNVLAVTHKAPSGMDVNVEYALTGGPLGSRVSQLRNTAVFSNPTNASGPVSFRLYAYSEFDIGGGWDQGPDGAYAHNSAQINGNTATQTGPDGWKVTETITTSPSSLSPNFRWAGINPAIPNAVFSGQDLRTLGTSEQLASGEGDADFAFQWDKITLAPGESVTITRTASVPEPATLMMLAGVLLMGGPAVLLLRRRKWRA